MTLPNFFSRKSLQKQSDNAIHFDPKEKRLLFISAHPDDADFCAGGTAISWLKQGAKGAIVIATNGDKGTADRAITSEQLVAMRHEEQLAASDFLGLEHTWFLDYPDAHLEISQALKEQLVKVIREYKPNAIFTFDPSMIYARELGFINHPDHRAIGQAAIDAVFPMARDFLTFPHHAQAGLEPHKVTDLFLYNFAQPTDIVDITDTVEQKFELLATHKSQVDMPETRKLVCEWDNSFGKTIGCTYAEAFVHITLS